MRGHEGDDHEGPEAHACDGGGARRGRAGGGCGHGLSSVGDLFDRAAPTYDLAAIPLFARFGAALVKWARLTGDERVLDAGCGAGAVLAPASRVAGSAVGIELSPGMAERAREAAPEAQVVVGDASSLPFDDAGFDVVLSAFVIFFIDDATAALREWKRVLKPGGRLVLATWGDRDTRWDFERDIRRESARRVDPEKLPEIMHGLELLERWTTADKVAAELGRAGFSDVETSRHEIEFVFRDEQAWWDWNWSHGARIFFEALPIGAREQLRAQMRKAMELVRDERGYPRTYTALFTCATA